jgi:hypothetical protein
MAEHRPVEPKVVGSSPIILAPLRDSSMHIKFDNRLQIIKDQETKTTYHVVTVFENHHDEEHSKRFLIACWGQRDSPTLRAVATMKKQNISCSRFTTEEVDLLSWGGS